MNSISFYKMSGCGNDFIIIDNRDKLIEEENLAKLIIGVCRRKLSVGADGFILIEPSQTVDFRWRFYNSDGSKAEMCGNGARCAARFAFINGIAGSVMSFETDAGTVHAEVTDDRVKLKMPDPTYLRLDDTIALKSGPLTVNRINTGVPHVVILQDQIEDVPVFELGREIRNHSAFAPAGTNVNFICAQKHGGIAIRTYERGVEDETLACGTGSIAGALVAARKLQQVSPINVQTRSGAYLTIHYKEENARFYDICLEGDARIIYSGKLWDEAWMDRASFESSLVNSVQKMHRE